MQASFLYEGFRAKAVQEEAHPVGWWRLPRRCVEKDWCMGRENQLGPLLFRILTVRLEEPFKYSL